MAALKHEAPGQRGVVTRRPLLVILIAVLVLAALAA